MRQESTFTLTISRVDEQLFRGEADSVTIPAESGQMTVLAHHEPIITLLREGAITVRTKDSESVFEIGKGMCEISNNQVTILVQAHIKK